MNIKDFKFKKHFGQNFIKDERILNKIINLSDIKEKSLVIEIGCGSGELTKKLINNFDYVLGYEIDKELTDYLKKIEVNNLKIIYDDFLKRNIKEDIKDIEYENLYIIANLPYYITTPIIEKIILEDLNIYEIIIMVQKEVGERISAKPNSREYSSLSVFINYSYNVKKLLKVSRHSFVPKPNVDSVVLKLSKKESKNKPLDEDYFYKLIRESFKFKRKTLKNNLLKYNFDIIEEYLLKNDKSKNVRAEQLTIENFIDISNILYLNEN